MLPPTPSDGTIIASGSLVLVYEAHDSIKPVHVTPGAFYQNKYGVFWHDEWLGKPFGSKVRPIDRAWDRVHCGSSMDTNPSCASSSSREP
jgi:hypothetical protein